MKKVYLDNAATTPLRKEVILKMQDALQNLYGNPSSTHSFGRSAKTAVERARKTIAKELHAEPSEIIFTSGGTEADNMILRGAVKDLEVTTIITSKIEHHAVLHTVEELEKENGITIKYVDLDSHGTPCLLHLKELLEADSVATLVSIMHVNNEIGNKVDIKALVTLCQEYQVLLHSDTVQSIGHYRLNVKETPIDFFTAAAHKFHGPKGIGFAYIKKGSGLQSWISGGEQERGYRAGTESVHNIIGMEAAFVQSYTHLEQESALVKELKDYFIETIAKEIPGVAFNGHSGNTDRSTYTLVNIRLPLEEEKAKMLLFHLDIKGIACSRGSACQSGSSTGSHVLSEVLNTEEFKKPSVRFSFSVFNKKEEIDYTIAALKELVEK